MTRITAKKVTRKAAVGAMSTHTDPALTPPSGSKKPVKKGKR